MDKEKQALVDGRAERIKEMLDNVKTLHGERFLNVVQVMFTMLQVQTVVTLAHSLDGGNKILFEQMMEQLAHGIRKACHDVSENDFNEATAIAARLAVLAVVKPGGAPEKDFH